MKHGSQRSASALKFRSRPVGVLALGHRSAGAQLALSLIFLANSTSTHIMHSQFHLYKASTSLQFTTNQVVNSNYTQLYSLNSLNKVNYQLPLLNKATLQTQTAQRTPKRI